MQNQFNRLQDAVSAYWYDEDTYVKSLARSHTLRRDLLKELIPVLNLPAGSSGVDMGCGIGLATSIMSICRPDLTITGVDVSDKFIRISQKISNDLTGTGQIRFQQGSALDCGLGDGAADWLFSMDCVGFSPGLGRQAIDEARRVLAGNGQVILAAWSSQMILPGYPMLEARLNASKQGIAPFEETADPSDHFMRIRQVLSQAGFSQIRTRTVVQDITGPLDKPMRLAMQDLIRMRWPRNPDHLLRDDQDLFQELIDDTSSRYILNDPYYQGFFTYTVVTARK
ncbi:MAG: class I SAM-dependent methyltransferase [Desulfobacteraceae bacterium]|nr:MAG: class I SAM-dependent methyltransferase [Desulfobacteraceae bacterium]